MAIELAVQNTRDDWERWREFYCTNTPEGRALGRKFFQLSQGFFIVIGLGIAATGHFVFAVVLFVIMEAVFFIHGGRHPVREHALKITRWQFDNRWRQMQDSFLMPKTFALSATGLTLNRDDEIHAYPWRHITEVYEDDDMTYFLNGGRMVVAIIPRRAFAVETDYLAFRDFVRQTKTTVTMPAEASRKVRVPAGAKMSTLAIVSSTLGWLGLAFVLPAIPAIVCGHLAKRQIRSSSAPMGGDDYATTGLILGYVGLFLMPLVVVGMMLFIDFYMSPAFR